MAVPLGVLGGSSRVRAVEFASLVRFLSEILRVPSIVMGLFICVLGAAVQENRFRGRLACLMLRSSDFEEMLARARAGRASRSAAAMRAIRTVVLPRLRDRE
jgi:ABC-type phosphate transport system permease subunit